MYQLEKRKNTLLGLTEEVNSKLDVMSKGLSISRSAIVRNLVNSAYRTYEVDFTLPSMTHRQPRLDGVISEG